MNAEVAKFFAGVDTHRDSHHVVIIDALGKVLESFAIPATPAGYVEAMARAATFADLIIWGLEGTGSYGKPFANALVRANYTVFEVPGALTKRHRRRLRNPAKSDPHDAHAIAEAVLREHSTLPRYRSSDEHEATRLLYDRRTRTVHEQTSKINRIRALAIQLQLRLPKDLSTGRGVDQLDAAIAGIRPSGYAEYEMLDEVKALGSDLRRLQASIVDLEKRLRPFVDRLTPALLELRGCAYVSAGGLIGHSGPIEGYRDADQFAAHAGTSPVQCSSGKHQALRVNFGGNRQLNVCLHNIANVQMRTFGHAGKIYYDRKRSEGKSHREAMRCLKRRLATVVFRTLFSEAQRLAQLQQFAAAA